jgi:hypothetical protein
MVAIAVDEQHGRDIRGGRGRRRLAEGGSNDAKPGQGQGADALQDGSPRWLHVTIAFSFNDFNRYPGMSDRSPSAWPEPAMDCRHTPTFTGITAPEPNHA